MSIILGPDGNPISTKKPITREIAVASIRDKWSTYPSQGLTPDKLARIFKEADQGDVFRQAELFEEMEEKDGHLASILQTRKLAVLGTDYEIHSYSDDPDDVAAADLVESMMEFEGLEDALLDLLDAIGKGYAVTEIIWEIVNSQAVVTKLNWLHQKRFTYDDYQVMRLLTDQSPVMGIEIPENKFVIHRCKARSGHPSRAGVLRVVAWMYLFKNYGIKDWVTFAEVYGMPLRLGKYAADTSAEDKEALIQAVTMLGTDAAGIISKSTEIEFVEAVRSSGNIHQTLANFCNNEMSKAVLGQTLTTEVGDKGSYAASKTHGEVRQDIKEADCKALAETLRRYLVKPIVRFNLGDKPRLPYLKFNYEPPEDLKQEADTYKVLIVDIGLPVSKKHVYEKFGVPEPEEGEELLTPSTTQPILSTPLAMKKDVVPVINSTTSSTEPQENVDSLADKALAQAMPMINEMITPILNLISETESLEELRDKLAGIFTEIDTSQLEDLVARCMFIADLYGRVAADAKE